MQKFCIFDDKKCALVSDKAASCREFSKPVALSGWCISAGYRLRGQQMD
jgi:hypothetical protein